MNSGQLTWFLVSVVRNRPAGGPVSSHMLCILYVNAVGALLGIAGSLVDRLLPATASRRWLWCLVIGITLLVPPIYRANHTSPAESSFVEGLTSLDSSIGRVWLIASASLILWGIANAVRVSVLVRRAHRRLVDDIPVLVTDSVGPATVGFLRSRVLVPRWVLALPKPQRQYIVRHEYEHRKAHDAHLLFFASLGLILTPWNLALWWQIRRLHLAIEMDCDNRVVGALGDANAYGSLLLRVAEVSSRGPRLQPALLGGMGMLEQRLTMLLAPTPLPHVQRLLLPAFACILLFIVLSMPHPIRSSEHAHAAATAATQ